jgi:hypothetical protein
MYHGESKVRYVFRPRFVFTFTDIRFKLWHHRTVNKGQEFFDKLKIGINDVRLAFDLNI